MNGKFSRLLLMAVLVLFLLAMLLPGQDLRASPLAMSLDPGETQTFTCSGTLVMVRVNDKKVTLACSAAATATVAPTLVPTVVLPTVTPTPTKTSTPVPTATHDMASMSKWHPPLAHDGTTVHEHGDAPPSWVVAAGYDPAFDHPMNTPNENQILHKHIAMVGWSGQFVLTTGGTVNWYGIFHLDTNPGGYVSRLHSYQFWIQDATLKVSHFQGWLDFGQDNNVGPNLVDSCDSNSGVRPQIFPLKPNCPFHFENWYARDDQAGWMPTFGFNINSNYFLTNTAVATDPNTWTPRVDGRGDFNLTRRVEWAWRRQEFNLAIQQGRARGIVISPTTGIFWATQFGELVNGPTDPLCDGFHTRTYGVAPNARTFTILCAEQQVWPSLPTVSSEVTNNAVQRTFPGQQLNARGTPIPGTQVQLPN